MGRTAHVVWSSQALAVANSVAANTGTAPCSMYYHCSLLLSTHHNIHAVGHQVPHSPQQPAQAIRVRQVAVAATVVGPEIH